MSKENPFATAEGKRIDITEEQAKQIREMYKQVEKEFGERIRILSNKSNISSIMREQYLKEFTQDLQNRITILNYQLEGTITNNALEIAKAVTEDNEKMLKEMGFGGVFTTNFYIPQEAVNSIITGKLYEGKWTLSRAIWSDNQKKINDINSIVAKGLAENKSTYELAKDLERYVNPNARKEWSWSKVYPGTSKKIDYNAQRLARTMISHAYQEAFVLNTKDNPFIEAYQWEASNTDRTCEICAERDGRIYAKDELPLDHPNGMCTFIIVREKSYEEIATDLSNWVKGEGDSELNAELDKYADSLGYNVKAWTAATEPVQKANLDLSYKDVTTKWEKMYDKQDNEALEERLTQRALKVLSDKELRALNAYTGTQYSYINSYERGNKNIPSVAKQNAKIIEKALDKVKVGEDLVTKRGIGIEYFNKLLNENSNTNGWKYGDNPELLKGKTFIEKGFYSSSLSGGGINNDKIEITSFVSSSINGVYLGQISNNELEKELLIQKDYNYDIVKAEYEDEKLNLWVIINSK